MENINKFLSDPILRQGSAVLDHDLESILDTHFESLAETTYKPFVFSASDLGSDGKSLCGNYTIGCGLRMFYRYLGFTPKPTMSAGQFRRVSIGHAIHDIIQNALHDISKAGVEIQDFRSEVRFDETNCSLAKKLRIRTTTDGIYTANGQKFLLEIKSIGEKSFDKLVTAQSKHVTQAHVYMALADIPLCNMYYVSLGGYSPTKSYIIPFNRNHWEAILAKIDYVKECGVTGTFPKKEPHFFCSSCNFYYLCQPEGTRRKKTPVRRLLSHGV